MLTYLPKNNKISILLFLSIVAAAPTFLVG